MPLDAVFLTGLTRELEARVTGAKIDKVQQPERDLLLLSLRTRDGNEKLLINGGVGSARVHLTQGSFENPQEPPMFCMLLRKHLVGARIESLVQPDFERLLILNLDARDEMGTAVKKQLVVEMLGRQSNVILVGPEDTREVMRGLMSARYPKSSVRMVREAEDAAALVRELATEGDSVLYEGVYPEEE